MARYKRNRKITKKSRMSQTATGIAALMLAAFIMCMGYWQVDATCTKRAVAIEKAEAQLKKLQETYVREDARWNSMTTRERLGAALVRFGISMDQPRADQLVRLDAAGHPKGGVSVARARTRQNRANERVARRSGR